MNEFCFVCLLLSVQLDIALTQRWWYIPVPSYAQQPQHNPQYTVAGWAKSPTTEPPLGPNDRVNTTDVPEEIEARPDLTRKERRMLLKRMNPGATPEQIEAQLLRDDKARARMAATQSEPIVIQPEPVTPPTVPPTVKPVTPTLKPTPVPQPIVQTKTNPKQAAQTKTNSKQAAQTKTNPKKSVQIKPKPKQTVNKQTKPKPTIKKQTKPKLTVKKTNKKRTKQRRQRTKPKQAQPAQPEQTEINNGENLQVWRPGMGKLSLTYQPTTARPRNQYRFYRTTTAGWWMRQTTAPTEPPLPTTLPPTYPTTQYQYFPTTYQTSYPTYEPIVTNPPRRRVQPRRRVPPRRRGPPRRQNNYRQQQRRQRPQLGRRQRNRARTDGEEFRPRDPFARWIFNNVEGEVLESFLPFLALG